MLHYWLTDLLLLALPLIIVKCIKSCLLVLHSHMASSRMPSKASSRLAARAGGLPRAPDDCTACADTLPFLRSDGPTEYLCHPVFALSCCPLRSKLWMGRLQVGLLVRVVLQPQMVWAEIVEIISWAGAVRTCRWDGAVWCLEKTWTIRSKRIYNFLLFYVNFMSLILVLY